MPKSLPEPVYIFTAHMCHKYQNLVRWLICFYHAWSGSRKLCQTGSKFDKFFLKFFLVDVGIEDQNITIMGHHWPAKKCHLNGVSLVGQ